MDSFLASSTLPSELDQDLLLSWFQETAATANDAISATSGPWVSSMRLGLDTARSICLISVHTDHFL